MEELYKQLAALARQHGARRLVLFGSRARGDNRYNSDVDLGVYGMRRATGQTSGWIARTYPRC